MFSKQWKARVEAAGISMVRIKREEKKGTTVQLVYPFTEALAEAMGGDAPVAQEVLARSGESKCKVKDQNLVLDSGTVKMVLSAGREDKLEVERTNSLTAKAKRPTTEGGTDPVLVVKVSWKPDDDGEADLALQFLHEHLGETLNVRMDRRQMEFSAGEEE